MKKKTIAIIIMVTVVSFAIGMYTLGHSKTSGSHTNNTSKRSSKPDKKSENKDEKQPSQSSDAQNNNTNQEQAQMSSKDNSQVQTTPADNQNHQQAEASAQANQEPQAPVQAASTYGVFMKGHQFDSPSYSDTTGQHMPTYTNNMWNFTPFHNYYLAELCSLAGQYTHALSYGEEVIVQGRKLHVSGIESHLQRLADTAYDHAEAVSEAHQASIQVCDDLTGNYVSIVTLD